MDSDTKFRFFQALVKLGYKEIEVSYPSSSQTDFDFTKRLIETPNIIPDDVCIQVMSPCREELIRQTVSSVLGAKNATIHIYLATAECFRRVVFNMTEGETLDLAVRSAKLVRELTKDSEDPVAQSTEWMLEFTPEVFEDPLLEFALRVCEAVKAAWDLQSIFQLSSTCLLLLKWLCRTFSPIKSNAFVRVFRNERKFVSHYTITMTVDAL